MGRHINQEDGNLTMNIRSVTEADAERWWALRLRALRDNPEAFASSYEQSRDTPVEEVRERIRKYDAENFALVAEVDNSFAGMVGLYRESHTKLQHRGRVWGMYVAPEYRGTGVGRALMHDLIIRAKQVEGLRQLELEVAEVAASAQGLYRSLGFERYGTVPQAIHVDGRYLDVEWMVLFLQS